MTELNEQELEGQVPEALESVPTPEAEKIESESGESYPEGAAEPSVSEQENLPENPVEPSVSVPEIAADGSQMDAERIQRIQRYVDMAFQEGPQKAIDEARKTGDDALVDDVHAALSRPDIHGKLGSLGKLPLVK